jgi:gamma-glutamylcysteine synthetase
MQFVNAIHFTVICFKLGEYSLKSALSGRYMSELSNNNIMISNFRRFLNVVCFLLGNSPASEFQAPGNYPEERIQ